MGKYEKVAVTCFRCKDEIDSIRLGNERILCESCEPPRRPTGLPANRPDYRREYGLKRNYNLTILEFEKIWRSQGSVCRICKQNPKMKRNPHVDHDHITRRVRGILCTQCNVMIGMARDSTKILRDAIAYLEEER